MRSIGILGLDAAGEQGYGIARRAHPSPARPRGLDHSIYFFDPNDHRLELACPAPDEASIFERLDAVKWEMLEEWSRTKRAPCHAAFLHEREFTK